MEGISFDEQQVRRTRPVETGRTGLAELLIRSGIAKSKAGANAMLIALALVIALAAVAILVLGRQQSEPKAPPGIPVLTQPNAPPRLSVPVGHRP